MILAIFFDPFGVQAVNSSVLTLNPYDFNSFTMYDRVFANAGVSGGLGPKSNCFFACVIARSPLKALRIGRGVGVDELDEVLTREFGGISFLGQPPNKNGSCEQADCHQTTCIPSFVACHFIYLECPTFGSAFALAARARKIESNTRVPTASGFCRRRRTLPTW